MAVLVPADTNGERMRRAVDPGRSVKAAASQGEATRPLTSFSTNLRALPGDDQELVTARRL